ncbi:PucR family transcriptional regulator [Nocardia yamanashiensis]|uniref:PucR family transcriptional regulator n=1 Tax=Nocardia yamanashiensis TaxID=209247 RepID=UPI00147215F3|nr:helix-turn-helix domain-containing protein [Nocardia yamanashiensis]
MGATVEPPQAAQLRRLLAGLMEQKEQLIDAMARRSQAAAAGYSAISAATVARTSPVLFDRMIDALGRRSPLNEDDLHVFREYGKIRAQQGLSLPDVQHSWRVAIQDILFAITKVGRDLEIPDALLLDTTHQMLALVDQATTAYAAAHRDVELQLSRRDLHMRADFTRALLLGTLGAAAVRQQADHYGLDPDVEYRAFRTRLTDSDTTDASPWSMRAAASYGLTTVIDGDLAGVLETAKTLDTTSTIGVGPPVPLADLPRSFGLAGRALTTAVAFGRPGPNTLESLGVLPAVIADHDLGTELFRQLLLPLGTDAQAQLLIDTVDRYIDTGMRADLTAAQLVVHPNTVRYRIARFEDLTGTDLRKPHAALRVWWAIRYRETTRRGR